MAGASFGSEGQRKTPRDLEVLAAKVPDRRFPCVFNGSWPPRPGGSLCGTQGRVKQIRHGRARRLAPSVPASADVGANWPEYGSFFALGCADRPRRHPDAHVAEKPDGFLVSRRCGCYTSLHTSAAVSPKCQVYRWVHADQYPRRTILERSRHRPRDCQYPCVRARRGHRDERAVDCRHSSDRPLGPGRRSRGEGHARSDARQYHGHPAAQGRRHRGLRRHREDAAPLHQQSAPAADPRASAHRDRRAVRASPRWKSGPFATPPCRREPARSI